MSKIFNDEWMNANGFLEDHRRKDTVGDVLRAKQPLPPLITVTETQPVKEALDLLRRYEISQLPVMRGREVVGSINDVAVMQAGPSATSIQALRSGRLALVGIGVEPGLSDVFARYAVDHLFSDIDELGTRDGANLTVDGYDFAPSFSI